MRLTPRRRSRLALGRFLSRCDLGVALRYFINRHVGLGRFLEYGYLPMDNGIVDRLHVRAALTRKNLLFAGADSGDERAAIAFTILGSCRLAGVDPIENLIGVRQG